MPLRSAADLPGGLRVRAVVAVVAQGAVACVRAAVQAFPGHSACGAPSESYHRPGDVLGSRHDLLQRRRKAPDLALLYDECGQRLDYVHAPTGNLAEDPVIVEQRHGYKL